GVGSAIAEFQATRHAELHTLYQHSLFFRTLLENSMQSHAKSNFKATHYLANHPDFGDFWKMLYDEYELTYKMLRELSGQSQLLSGNDMSRSSIALREQIVLPLIAIQQFALQKLQDETLPEAEAAVYRKLVLRAMFGIINAARNAA
ncbi:MAG: phosphoenolpyruvate carboxylase, partial [Saprospiraceae bacterium]|nr:phosphoenolpyruvate carboxylase [Saprospiraceae bacterium]